MALLLAAILAETSGALRRPSSKYQIPNSKQQIANSRRFLIGLPPKCCALATFTATAIGWDLRVPGTREEKRTCARFAFACEISQAIAAARSSLPVLRLTSEAAEQVHVPTKEQLGYPARAGQLSISPRHRPRPLQPLIEP